MREMKKQLLMLAACGATLMIANDVKAQTYVVEETTVTTVDQVNCKDIYTTGSWKNNWYIQLGAGIRSPFVENNATRYTDSRRLTPTYKLAVGRWISPYLGFRFDANYGGMRWNDRVTARAKTANVNVDFMWDMFNSMHGYNPSRVFSMIPFIGLGSTFVWDYKGVTSANMREGEGAGRTKSNEWMFPVSAGLQLRFRCSEYVDIFAEGRGSFYGDNFNNVAYGKPVDIDVSATAGLIIHFTGSKFEKYNPCDYANALAQANAQANELRAALASTSAALAAAEAQLPCPEMEVQEVIAGTPVVLPTVRFKINSAYVSSEEMVNVYNVAEYLKANPGTQIVIAGYADKDTGSTAYNMKLSERRAQAVADILTGDYGIDASRLILEAAGSDIQPYKTNDWNRIVIFAVPE